ncbi:hypothetical protein BC832DRAFT_477624 [Gaertneriomyces semiglobifer]|nr:hypothetical protein BC832DRAFT_477624 [Gaertneriomyces semiglobifer]
MLRTPQTSTENLISDENLASEVHAGIFSVFPGLNDAALEHLQNDDLEMVAVEGPIRAMKRALARKGGANDVPQSKQQLIAWVAPLFKPDVVHRVDVHLSEDIVGRLTYHMWACDILDHAARPGAATSLPAGSDTPVQPSTAPVQRMDSRGRLESNVKLFEAQARPLEMQERARTQGVMVLAHATKSAYLPFFAEGIDLRRSHMNSEFARFGAFYMTPHIAFALRWAGRLYAHEVAVLIFKVPIAHFESARTHRFPDADTNWQKFCHHNFTQESEHTLSRANDYIHGPICTY